MNVLVFIIAYCIIGAAAQYLFVRDFCEKLVHPLTKRDAPTTEKTDYRTYTEDDLDTVVLERAEKDIFRKSIIKKFLMTILSLIVWPVSVPFGLFMVHKVWTPDQVLKDLEE